MPMTRKIKIKNKIKKSNIQHKKGKGSSSIIDCNYSSPLYFLPKLGGYNFDE